MAGVDALDLYYAFGVDLAWAGDHDEDGREDVLVAYGYYVELGGGGGAWVYGVPREGWVTPEEAAFAHWGVPGDLSTLTSGDVADLDGDGLDEVLLGLRFWGDGSAERGAALVIPGTAW